MDFEESQFSQQPLIMDFKGNSLDDGPGIRSVIFFKGCNLNCAWCHNPESKSRNSELLFEVEKCIQCLDCIAVCPTRAITFREQIQIDRPLCAHCFKCEDVCHAGALQRIGQFYTVQEICDQIVPYKNFFHISQGGVTISGGEATIHISFLHQLLKELKTHGLHILLETNGVFNYHQFRKLVLPYIDLIYMDIKLMNQELHQKYCGQSNTIILKNFSQIFEDSQHSSFTIIPRTPLIPEITDTEDNLQSLRIFLEDLGVPELYLLSNNAIWFSKCEKFGYARPFTPNHPIFQIYSDIQKKKVMKIFNKSTISIHLS